jgi:hypothetical protein
MIMSDPANSPWRPRLALRVGIIGHQKERLHLEDDSALAESLCQVLSIIQSFVSDQFRQSPNGKNLYNDQKPVLRAVSMQSHGADQLFSAVASQLGYEFCGILPFDSSVSEPNDPSTTGKPLEQREQIQFILDGVSEKESESISAAGKVLLNQSDLLIVVWDGQWQANPGNTERFLDIALQLHLPVVWVDARPPHHWKLLETPFENNKNQEVLPPPEEEDDKLVEKVNSLIDLPEDASTDTHASTGLKSLFQKRSSTIFCFYEEKKPRVSPVIIWWMFRELFGRVKAIALNEKHDRTSEQQKPTKKPFKRKLNWPAFRIPEFETDVEKSWPRKSSTPIQRIVDHLRPYYAWPDKLAVYYSNAYRSAFILVYFLAAMAVGLALLPVAAGWQAGIHHWGETACIELELFTIFIILVLVIRGRIRGWHERWIDYRLAAELVRHLRLVAPLGGGRPFPEPAAHLRTYGHPATSWASWYVRAVERDMGPPNVKVTVSHLEEALSTISDLIDEQIDYHKSNSDRCMVIEKRLHGFGLILVAATLIACICHLLPALFFTLVFPKPWLWILTFLCGFLPALGAATAGINNQGEFLRIAKRSKSMIESLTKLKMEDLTRVKKDLKELKEKAAAPEEKTNNDIHILFSQKIEKATSKAAQLMVNEVLDWRVVFVDRPLNPPT